MQMPRAAATAAAPTSASSGGRTAGQPMTASALPGESTSLRASGQSGETTSARRGDGDRERTAGS